MPSRLEQALTQGLAAGYGGETNITTIRRGSFELKSSQFSDNGIEYNDQWVSGEAGGGQELVRAGQEEFTRLYAGGKIIDKDGKLKKLGITGKDIIGYLIQQVSSLGPKTRLLADCHPKAQNGWRYDYQFLETEPEVGVSVTKETIEYNGELVFVHYFLLCGIR